MQFFKSAIRFLLPLLLLIPLILSLPGCSGQEKREDLKAGAWDFMAQQVAAQLGSPKSLAFPPDGVSNVTQLAENRFQITSFADYTNDQGQQEHAYFHGTVLYRNSAWTLESLKFAE